MAVLEPITCIRPAPEMAAKVATGPHSVMSREAIREKILSNPYSYSRIVHPRALYGDGNGVYRKAAEILRGWVSDGIMQEDEEPSFYIYRMEQRGHVQNGFVGRTAVDEIISGRVHAHENIREQKLQDLSKHIKDCRAQIGGPILAAYRAKDEIREWVRRAEEQEPLYDFVSENQVVNRIWKISDPERLREVREMMARAGDLYIADGHHRVMAGVEICLKKRSENPQYTGHEPWNYLACVCFPDDELRILPYSRIVTRIRDLTAETLYRKLKGSFDLILADRSAQPRRRGEFILMRGKERCRLCFHEKLRPAEPPACLDVSVLQDRILGPVFGIGDPASDPRLEFIGGFRQGQAAAERCRRKDTCAFLLYPTSMEELFSVADAGATMPPKSTWFEPKLCNGLFIYRLE